MDDLRHRRTDARADHCRWAGPPLVVAIDADGNGVRHAIEEHGADRYRCVDEADGADVLVTDDVGPDGIAARRVRHPDAILLVVTDHQTSPAAVVACLAAGADCTAPATPRILVAHLDALARRRALVEAHGLARAG